MVTVTYSPADLGLPFASWRPHQQETISRIAASSAETHLLEAPTGFGKGAVAVGVLQLQQARGVILTHTKALQEEYAVRFPWIASVQGAGNFPGNTDAYLEQRDRGLTTRVMVTNYQWFLRAANLDQPPQTLDWLVCDEAHAIEDAIGILLELTLDRPRYRCLGLEFPPAYDWRGFESYARDTLPRVQEALETCRTRRLADSRPDSLMKDLQYLQWALWLITRPGLGWVATERGEVIELRPSRPGLLAPHLLFRHARRHLLMSATILHHEAFAYSLRVSRWEAVSVPSIIHPSRRPVYYQPAASMGRKRRGPNSASLQALTQAVDRIIAHHQGQSGVIHTVNYQIAEDLVRTSAYRHLFITHQDSATRGYALARFQQTPGSILVSPSMDLGVDLPADSARWQIICKMPFPNLAVPAVDMRQRADPSWYAWRTLTRLVQACGRIVRGEDDWGLTYILDADLMILQPYFSLVPTWFWEAFYSPR